MTRKADPTDKTSGSRTDVQPEIRSSSCFVPGHITGFFEICDDDDPHRKGSRGCGLVPDIGLTTTVRLIPAEERENDPSSAVSDISDANIRIFLNGREVPGQVIRNVLSVLKITPPPGFSIEVSGVSDLPVGCGFGMSAAGALGTAFASNDLFRLHLPADDLTEAAHAAEVMNGSGLGDVAGCSTGGLVLREAPGGPKYGSFRRIPVSPRKIFCLVLGVLDTSTVLSDPERARKIKEEGRIAMARFLQDETFDSFMAVSRAFSEKIGLMSPEAAAAINALDPSLAEASQAMLGNTVFAAAVVPGSPEAEKHIYETLSRFGKVIVFNIGFRTPELI